MFTQKSVQRANSTGTGVILESAQRIPMYSPREVWRNWLYFAKVHLLAGPPSSGKTTIAMSIASTISTGGTWPDGTRSPYGRVLIWSSEDGVEDTIIPRLVAMGANLSNIEVVRMTEESWLRRPFDPVRDLPLLEEKIRQLNDVVLVIVDSIAELMPGSPGNNNKVRKSLLPLVGLAERTNCAVLGLTHVVKASKNKHPLERIIGGVGLGAVVRVAMLVARDDNGSFGAVREWNVLVKAKANICREDGGVLYRTEGMPISTPQGVINSSKIQWGQPLSGMAMDILNQVEGVNRNASVSKVQQASDFLMTTLQGGPLLASHVKTAAAQTGISEATLRRAYEQCGIQSFKQRGMGPASPFLWSLPMPVDNGFPNQGSSPPPWAINSISIGAKPDPVMGMAQLPIVPRAAKDSLPKQSAYLEQIEQVVPPAADSTERNVHIEQVEQGDPVEKHEQVEQPDQDEKVVQSNDSSINQLIGYLIPECRQAYKTLPRLDDDEGPEDELDFVTRVIDNVMDHVDGLNEHQMKELSNALWDSSPW